ncbi:hypothetical protein J3330_10590, partial [Leuconostoc mesenteroides]
SVYSYKLMIPLISGLLGMLGTVFIAKVIHTLIFPSSLILFGIDIVITGSLSFTVILLIGKKYGVYNDFS